VSSITKADKKKLKKILFYFFLGLCLVIGIYFFTRVPSNNRDWSLDQAILPSADINNNLVTIHNIRNFSYTSKTNYTPNYYDKTFDLNKIKKVYYVVEPFSSTKGAAHTFLSFEFEGNNFVAISIEIRKEKGEIFSAVKGLLRQYEIMYVIADERDVVKLRSNYRKDLVYIYPAKTTPEKMRSLFLDMVSEANKLVDKPEFYNSITNSCTSKIADHINNISPKRIPWSFKILFPKNSDKLAYDLGLLDTNLPWSEVRAKFLINDKALKYANDPDFSMKIRK
jgi:hypothetical protein